MKKRIGMTEAGDAAIDLSWYDKVLDDPELVGAILITKGIASKPFQEKALSLMKHKPVIIHADVTGWGQTPMEPMVKAPIESIQAIRAFIDNGFPAQNIVLRIDPIIPTKEGLERAANVVTLAKEIIPDVTRIRISIYDDYFNSRKEICKRGYEPIDDVEKRKNEIERRPTKEQVDIVAKTLMDVASKEQVFELCAEPELEQSYPDRFKWFGCLSMKDCEIMNIEPPRGIGINGQKRFGCRCLRMKVELLNKKRRCPHNCAYCYWGCN